MITKIPIEAAFRAPITPFASYNSVQKASFNAAIESGVPSLKYLPSEYITPQKANEMRTKRMLMEELKRNKISYDCYRRGELGGFDIEAFIIGKGLPLPVPVIHESDFIGFQLDILKKASEYRDPVKATGTECPQYYGFGDRERLLLSRYLEEEYKGAIEKEDKKRPVDVRLTYEKVFSRTREQHWRDIEWERKSRGGS